MAIEIELKVRLNDYAPVKATHESVLATYKTGDCEQSHGRLFALLEKLEIPAEWIEIRPYTAMLAGVLT